MNTNKPLGGMTIEELKTTIHKLRKEEQVVSKKHQKQVDELKSRERAIIRELEFREVQEAFAANPELTPFSKGDKVLITEGFHYFFGGKAGLVGEIIHIGTPCAIRVDLNDYVASFAQVSQMRKAWLDENTPHVYNPFT